MHFTTLVPSIFYVSITDGIKLFVECLQFRITHSEIHTTNPFCVIEKDGLQIYLFQDEVHANEHHPELRLVTNNIQEVYDQIVSTHPELLHPNLNTITLRPWGAKEFAIVDKQLGIRFQEW